MAVYAFGVYERGEIVAAFAWQPPPPGAARAVCPEAPSAVLALSRMVAVPREQRHLRHISRPLRRQMRHEIDRGRWPVLITYSDEGQGHTGHVYKCSGWTPTTRSEVPFYVDATGARVSTYSNGKTITKGKIRGGTTTVQRWEQWACQRGLADMWLSVRGWRREPTGKTWRSGRPAYRYVKVEPQ